MAAEPWTQQGSSKSAAVDCPLIALFSAHWPQSQPTKHSKFTTPVLKIQDRVHMFDHKTKTRPFQLWSNWACTKLSFTPTSSHLLHLRNCRLKFGNRRRHGISSVSHAVWRPKLRLKRLRRGCAASKYSYLKWIEMTWVDSPNHCLWWGQCDSPSNRSQLCSIVIGIK